MNSIKNKSHLVDSFKTITTHHGNSCIGNVTARHSNKGQNDYEDVNWYAILNNAFDNESRLYINDYKVVLQSRIRQERARSRANKEYIRDKDGRRYGKKEGK